MNALARCAYTGYVWAGQRHREGEPGFLRRGRHIDPSAVRLRDLRSDMEPNPSHCDRRETRREKTARKVFALPSRNSSPALATHRPNSPLSVMAPTVRRAVGAVFADEVQAQLPDPFAIAVRGFDNF